MFENLVESTSHKDDLSRKGGFFLGTLAIYGVLFVVLSIVGIVTYNDRLDALNMELTTMVAPVPIQQQPEQQEQKQEAKPQPVKDTQVATRTEFISSNLDPTKVPQKVESVASKIPPVPPGGAVLSNRNTDPVGGASGPVGPGSGTGGPIGGTAPPRPIVQTEDEPPPPKPTPEPKKNITISGGVLNGKAISKPTPPYPPIARAARASGVVVVAITVDESGKVISAHAVSGPALLQQAATQAAFQARFTPTMLSGQPVKVTGTISYNFTLQ
ncbi:MAG: periplasmic protein TonB [Acidobacteriota bacterium]|jgi:protein TonB|nr:periplasmic protein TonB [Acidobacteriota bacterium]